MSALRTRMALRRLDRGTRRRVIVAIDAVTVKPSPVPPTPVAPATSPRRPRLLVDLRAIPSSMEQRAARWVKP